MAITVDAISNGSASANSTTFNHTCAAGAFLLVGVVAFQSGGSSPTITAPTYNSVTMSLVKTNDDTNGSVVAWYSLTSPASGSHTVSISQSGVTSPVTGGASISFLAALGTGGTDSGIGSSGSATNNITTTKANGYLLQMLYGQDTVLGSFDGTQTSIINSLATGTANRIYAASYKADTTITSYPMTYNFNLGNARTYNTVGIEITAADVISSGASFLLRMV